MNSAFALFEILFTRVGPNPWSHILFLILILAGYIGIAYITRATEGFYGTFLFVFNLSRVTHAPPPFRAVYSFLDPGKQKGRLAAYLVGIPIANCILFAVAQGICILRERIIARLRDTGLAHPPEALEEWETVESPTDLEPMAV